MLIEIDSTSLPYPLLHYLTSKPILQNSPSYLSVSLDPIRTVETSHHSFDPSALFFTLVETNRKYSVIPYPFQNHSHLMYSINTISS